MKSEPFKAWACLCTLLLTACAGPPRVLVMSPPRSGVQVADMDLMARPQDDFFAYANGHWLARTPIPADLSRYGVDTMMAERSMMARRDIFVAAREAAAPEDRKVGALYASFMDEIAIEAKGLAPLAEQLKAIDEIKAAAGLAPLMARLDSIGVSTPIGAYVDPDARDARRNVLWLYESGLGLPSRDDYWAEDVRASGLRVTYRSYIQRMLILGGAPPEQAAADADAVLALETSIARLFWSPVDARDPIKTYNPMTLAELAKSAPGLDWAGWLSAQELTEEPRLIVREPDFFHGLSNLTRTTPLSIWRAYLRLRLLDAAAPYLSRTYADEAAGFHEGVLRGAKARGDRWKRGVNLVDRLMGDASGRLYVERYFTDASRARVEHMVDGLIQAQARRLHGATWMSASTRAEALRKLAKIDVKIGHPKRWRDYDHLEIDASDLLGNVFRATRFEWGRRRALLEALVDRSEWRMTAATVDAYYSPATNEIAFPAGVLQPPLFDASADDAYNYGATGATIGHEISHGFDLRGSRYDGEGNLKEWWTPEDRARYEAMSARLIQVFESFEPMPGQRVNGKLTLGENMADLAGLELAYDAWRASLKGRKPPVIDGLTGEQRFFVGYAQSFMVKRTDAALAIMLKTNPHAPERYRVNAIVGHLDAFHDAFGVRPGDPMFIPPEARLRVW